MPVVVFVVNIIRAFTFEFDLDSTALLLSKSNPVIINIIIVIFIIIINIINLLLL